MNRVELKKKLHVVMRQLLAEKHHISPLDVLLQLGIVLEKDCEDWRFGRVPYLEKICKMNLSALSFLMSEIKAYARSAGLKASPTVYIKRGGKGKKMPLRFSKSGNPKVEAAYATHYVRKKEVNEVINGANQEKTLKPKTIEDENNQIEHDEEWI